MYIKQRVAIIVMAANIKVLFYFWLLHIDCCKQLQSFGSIEVAVIHIIEVVVLL